MRIQYYVKCLRSALRGLFTALLVNHRYRFTTWKIGRPLLWLLAFGGGLKLLIHWLPRPRAPLDAAPAAWDTSVDEAEPPGGKRLAAPGAFGRRRTATARRA